MNNVSLTYFYNLTIFIGINQETNLNFTVKELFTVYTIFTQSVEIKAVYHKTLNIILMFQHHFGVALTKKIFQQLFHCIGSFDILNRNLKQSVRYSLHRNTNIYIGYEAFLGHRLMTLDFLYGHHYHNRQNRYLWYPMTKVLLIPQMDHFCT